MYIYICIYVHIYVYMYIYAYLHIYIYMHVFHSMKSYNSKTAEKSFPHFSSLCGLKGNFLVANRATVPMRL